jgi:hypothetical protein
MTVGSFPDSHYVNTALTVLCFACTAHYSSTAPLFTLKLTINAIYIITARSHVHSQVWYSASWSWRAQATFKAAVDTVLQRPQQQQQQLTPLPTVTAVPLQNQPLSAEVTRILKHWAASSGVSLAVARKGVHANGFCTKVHITYHTQALYK